MKGKAFAEPTRPHLIGTWYALLAIVAIAAMVHS